MKLQIAALLFAGSLQVPAAMAASPDRSPLFGRWAVETSRLPMPPAERPKSVSITFAEAGEDKLSTQVDIVDAGGTTRHAWGTAPLDGTPAPVEGNFEADLAAAKMPTPNVLIMQLAKGGVPASTRIYTVTADGKSMIETAAYFGQDGKPVMRTNYFTRVRWTAVPLQELRLTEKRILCARMTEEEEWRPQRDGSGGRAEARMAAEDRERGVGDGEYLAQRAFVRNQGE